MQNNENSGEITTLVVFQHGKAVTSSLQVAEVFKKRHDHILRDIEKMKCTQQFRVNNYSLKTYKSLQNKEMPFLEITKEGFVMYLLCVSDNNLQNMREFFAQNTEASVDEILSVGILEEEKQISVYLIEVAENHVKIGISENVAQRLKTLENTSGHTILRKYFITHKDAFKIENYLHKFFAKNKIKGEWFNIPFELAKEALENIL